MAVTKIHIEEFLELDKSIPIFDVRSPGEYEHAHIPKAHSLPLFTNDERKIVGTAYKKESREAAIKIGLAFFGTKTVKLIDEVEKKVSEKKYIKTVGIHCWRGGMRSAAIAWLLDLYGFKVYLLVGGYKAYRNWILLQFNKPYSLHILGGCTGSNKTGTLAELKKAGEYVVDLEGLAVHKGSTFGNLDLIAQPTQEMFENILATQLHIYGNKPNIIWIEDESQRIGNVNIPPEFYKTMRQKPVLFLDIVIEERLQHIIDGYGKYGKDKLINAIIRIKKKLGGLETKNAINFILEDDLKKCFSLLLSYYDKIYIKNTYNRVAAETDITKLSLISVNAKINSEIIIKHVYNR